MSSLGYNMWRCTSLYTNEVWPRNLVMSCRSKCRTVRYFNEILKLRPKSYKNVKFWENRIFLMTNPVYWFFLIFFFFNLMKKSFKKNLENFFLKKIYVFKLKNFIQNYQINFAHSFLMSSRIYRKWLHNVPGDEINFETQHLFT